MVCKNTVPTKKLRHPKKIKYKKKNAEKSNKFAPKSKYLHREIQNKLRRNQNKKMDPPPFLDT